MGNKTNKYLFWGITAGFILYLIILIISPKPIDWSLSFSREDDIPYGSKILFEELKTVFDSTNITTSHSPLYNFIKENDSERATYIIINISFHPEKPDLEKILSQVNLGSNVFVSASSFSQDLKDTLKFEVKSNFNIYPSDKDSLVLNLVNPVIKDSLGYIFKKAYSDNYFSKVDTINSVLLGIGNNGKANFIKTKYGKGNLYINLNPYAFTNYNLVTDNNYEYAFKSLSYLPTNTQVIWDEYYKAKPRPSNSLVRYILSQRALKYAWYILLFSVLSYLIFGAKRIQRKIPIVEAPQNTTLTFIETIGRLYFRRKNHLDIAQKKFAYFLEFLRSKYFINTSEINADMISETSNKLDIPEKTIKKLFSQAERLKMNISYTEEDLEQLSRNIEFIYQKCKK